jgi:hypothetical protein
MFAVIRLDARMERQAGVLARLAHVDRTCQLPLLFVMGNDDVVPDNNDPVVATWRLGFVTQTPVRAA